MIVSIEPGRRNVGVEQAYVRWPVFARYEDRWDLLLDPTTEAPVLLPPEFRSYARETKRVGLPPDHPWNEELPTWS